ncbi:hypothetical protein KY284_000567 [Solanum tuberosum]|nr:hypothetical protein KY284_000567 [Solanum tuberosum]
MVLCSGPHYMMRRPIIMKPWVPEFDYKEEILTTIPLWIKLPNLPLNDECTTQTSRISFARILVEVDVTRPLPKTIKIHDPKGRVMEQQIWYEWKPVQQKGAGHRQRKKWISIKDKQQGNATNQVGKQAQMQDEDQTTEAEQEGTNTVQVQKQWQVVRSKSSMRRDSDSRQGIHEELGTKFHSLQFDEGSLSGGTTGGMEGIPKPTLKA